MENCSEFQSTVGMYLVRHRSILDVLSKLQESSARTNRAITKAVTACGCVEIDANRQEMPDESNLGELIEYASTHLEGRLCPECRERIESELGKLLFYVAAICNLLDLKMDKIILQENKRISTLGIFSLT